MRGFKVEREVPLQELQHDYDRFFLRAKLNTFKKMRVLYPSIMPSCPALPPTICLTTVSLFFYFFSLAIKVVMMSDCLTQFRDFLHLSCSLSLS